MEGCIVCNGFTFYNDFDSANLQRVEMLCPCESVVSASIHSGKTTVELPDYEFNVWTKPDCFGSEYQNGNRTWFYFGMKAPFSTQLVRLNIVDLNKQSKMYSQGMAPVYRIVPGKLHWERVRDKPSYNTVSDVFTISFKYRTPENINAVTYFAFTYPYSYTELQKTLANVDLKHSNLVPHSQDDIYYQRECVCNSLEGRRVDLITVSSYHGISTERETRLANLFPDSSVQRPFKFIGKKVIFVSARVHPGETPSSFVFNGFMHLLLCRDDPIAIVLRRLYVFKLIPFLNPDGVVRGHYRTDTRGVNLNRVYLNPSQNLHPSVYAARSLLRYYHYGFEKEGEIIDLSAVKSRCDNCLSDEENLRNNDNNISKKVSSMSLDENHSSVWCIKCKGNILKLEQTMPGISDLVPTFNNNNNNNVSVGPNHCRNCGAVINTDLEDVSGDSTVVTGLFMYLDMHGHASKKGIFMYGNHFSDTERNVECMLLPKLMSLNNHNFHFTACNFTERNMYLRDKRDGMSREGSGRVAVLKMTGLTRSYTLECNYNSGRLVNNLPPTIKETSSKIHSLPVPPKYTPQIFEEVGRALGASILDLTGQNPNTRLPNSEFHSLTGIRDFLKINCNSSSDFPDPVIRVSNPSKFKMKNSSSLHSQGKPTRSSVIVKSRPPLIKPSSKKSSNKSRPSTVPVERKENMAAFFNNPQPSCSYLTNHPPIRLKNTIRSNKAPTTSNTHRNNNNVNKSKKDASLKCKTNTNQDKQKKLIKSTTGSVNSKLSNASASKEDKRVQLREICFLKSNGGKTLIAKFQSSSVSKDNKNKLYDDNLVVSWEGTTNNQQVFTHKTSLVPASPVPFVPIKVLSEPGTSKQQQGAFRVHNFSKNTSYSSKAKVIKKHTLRRLASATEAAGKIDKNKKKMSKKLKTK